MIPRKNTTRRYCTGIPKIGNLSLTATTRMEIAKRAPMMTKIERRDMWDRRTIDIAGLSVGLPGEGSGQIIAVSTCFQRFPRPVECFGLFHRAAFPRSVKWLGLYFTGSFCLFNHGWTRISAFCFPNFRFCFSALRRTLAAWFRQPNG